MGISSSHLEWLQIKYPYFLLFKFKFIQDDLQNQMGYSRTTLENENL